MYKVLAKFADLKDGKHLYNAGDIFPRAGYKPTKERIAELCGTDNLMGRRLLEEIENGTDTDGDLPAPEELVHKKTRRKRSGKADGDLHDIGGSVAE